MRSMCWRQPVQLFASCLVVARRHLLTPFAAKYLSFEGRRQTRNHRLSNVRSNSRMLHGLQRNDLTSHQGHVRSASIKHMMRSAHVAKIQTSHNMHKAFQKYPLLACFSASSSSIFSH